MGQRHISPNRGKGPATLLTPLGGVPWRAGVGLSTPSGRQRGLNDGRVRNRIHENGVRGR